MSFSDCSVARIPPFDPPFHNEDYGVRARNLRVRFCCSACDRGTDHFTHFELRSARVSRPHRIVALRSARVS